MQICGIEPFLDCRPFHVRDQPDILQRNHFNLGRTLLALCAPGASPSQNQHGFGFNPDLCPLCHEHRLPADPENRNVYSLAKPSQEVFSNALKTSENFLQSRNP
jgi:hypothetical protein